MTIDRRTFLTGAAVLPFVGLTTRDAFADTGKDVLVVALQTDNVTSLDPHEGFEAVGGEINSNIYQKLVRASVEDPNKLDGEIAQSWSMSDDGKTLTLKIKPGLKFASGGPLTAEDCAFSLSRAVIMNKSPAFIINQFGFTKDNVAERITAPDAATLILKLEKPTATSFLLYCLSANVAAVIEKKVVMEKAQGDDLGNGWLRQNSAGSGPWMLRQWKPSESVIFDANPQTGPVNGIKRIIIRHIVDPSAQLMMLQKGDVDVARNLTSEQLKQLVNDPNYTLVRRATASIVAMSMNQRVPQLTKVEVRQAIKWAIDYEGIQKNITPMTHILRQSFLPEGFPAAQKEGPFKRDVAKAKALMAAAGLADGFEISMDHYSAQPNSDIAQAVQANLADIGIKVKLVASENRQVLTKMRARQHELAITAWGSDYFDPNTNAEAYCVNTDNSDDARNRTLAWRSNWKDDEISKLALDALEEKDSDKRAAIYQKLQTLHQERAPFAPILQTVAWAACRKNVLGIRLGVLPDGHSYANVKKS
jgi:peptide/nickel transport system substrate-binding protein